MPPALPDPNESINDAHSRYTSALESLMKDMEVVSLLPLALTSRPPGLHPPCRLPSPVFVISASL